MRYCSIEILNLAAVFKISGILKGFVWEKVAGEQGFPALFSALFISGIHKMAGLNLRVGRSRDQVIQRAQIPRLP